MADSEVDALQEKIDSVTERMKTSEFQLNQLQHKLRTLSNALSELDEVDAESFVDSAGQLFREGAPHQELSTEARQNQERAIRAFNLNPWRGVELIKEETGGSVDDLVAFFIG
jgi:chaperonin cofactor prefoldin